MKSKKYKHPFTRISDRETYVRFIDGDIYTSTTATSCTEQSLHDWRRRVAHKFMRRSVIKHYNKQLGPQLQLRSDFFVTTLKDAA